MPHLASLIQRMAVSPTLSSYVPMRMQSAVQVGKGLLNVCLGSIVLCYTSQLKSTHADLPTLQFGPKYHFFQKVLPGNIS